MAIQEVKDLRSAMQEAAAANAREISRLAGRLTLIEERIKKLEMPAPAVPQQPVERRVVPVQPKDKDKETA